MNTKALIAVGAISLAASAGAITYYFWPTPIPAFQVKNERGEPVAFDTLFGEKDYMLVVFLLPGCPISKYSSEIVNTEYGNYADRMSFVGLIFGNYETGQSYAKENNLSFPVYGLRDTPDPFAVNELIHVVGSQYGMGSAIYGGTVIVVDREGDIVFELEKEEVKELPKRLGSAH